MDDSLLIVAVLLNVFSAIANLSIVVGDGDNYVSRFFIVANVLVLGMLALVNG